ncbi:MAG: EAL domain-containing protein [Pseudohongiella sp.]
MKQILLVDDNEDNLYYLETLLGGHGYQTITARHGAEALVKARKRAPDILISDLLMPVMDGYTLLRHWKHDPALSGIPFIVYTATYTEPEDEELAVSLGADAFVLKPAEPDVFMSKLHAVEKRVVEDCLNTPAQPAGDQQELLKVYSETLIRKLEEKMLQLEEANRELQLDIARRKEAEDKIEQLAFYDPLTGLPNRRLMQDRLQHSIAASSRLQRYGALLFIDLDDFKTLNDTRGHNVGDKLLMMAAQRLDGCVREGDTVARFGGDEFVVILEALSEHVDQAATRAEVAGEKILRAMSQPYPLQGEDYHGSASVGVSLFCDRDISAEELIRRADTAMYQAKRSGRDTLYFYDPAMQAALEARLQMETDLRRALEEKQFCLYYQSQVDSDVNVIGAEALIRWISPQKGLISPGDFISLAEETGLIVPIGNWVLNAACRKLKIWENSAQTAGLQLAVNVSARQFHQDDFVDQVLNAVNSNRIRPDRLKLELTESLIMDNVDSAVEKMNALGDAGVRFSMDDFGTGYSSLSYLTQLPLHQLKIDQSFVHKMHDKPVNAVIVQTIIGMAENLDIEVIAEGVETHKQFQFLKDHGCPLFQGFHFGKPVPETAFEKALNK